VWTGQVQYLDQTNSLDFLARTFDYCFGRNLLIISPIDPILLPLTS
jgi:hypothetical protein